VGAIGASRIDSQKVQRADEWRIFLKATILGSEALKSFEAKIRIAK
jgi:hypothetical protein